MEKTDLPREYKEILCRKKSTAQNAKYQKNVAGNDFKREESRLPRKSFIQTKNMKWSNYKGGVEYKGSTWTYDYEMSPHHSYLVRMMLLIRVCAISKFLCVIFRIFAMWQSPPPWIFNGGGGWH